MDKPQIIGLGLNGLIGTRLTELLKDDLEFISLSRSTGVDITNKQSLSQIGNHKRSNFVIHLAAKTDVDSCEKDKDLGVGGEAWKINVGGVQNVAQMCNDFGKKLIYISTDFVFDGDLEPGQGYSETDVPNPINWYAKTKYEGEKVVEQSGADYMILRLAYPYRAEFDKKPDFFRAIRDRLEKGEQVKSVTDHIFCPTFIDDVAKAILTLVRNDASGIFHVVGNSSLSPHDASLTIAETFGLNKDLVLETTREEFFKDRAPRPFNLALTNDKIAELGISMRSFEEGLLEIKSQLS